MNKEELLKAVKEQLACEFNCRPEDFTGEENIITSPVLHEKRRMFSDKEFFLQMATFGNNAVISANEKMHPWLKEWIKDKRGFWLFEQHNFYELEKELRKYGYKMSLTHHMFLPVPEITDLKTDLEIKWLEQQDIRQYYGKEELTNLAEKAGKQHTTEIFFVDFLMELTDIDIDTATLVVEKLVDEYELNYDANFDDLKNEEEVEQYKKEFPERYENSGEYDYIESIINNDK